MRILHTGAIVLRWSVYVSNIVAEIQRHLNIQQWRYVPSTHNPANCDSRGILPEDLVENRIWWHRPEFLKGPPSCWPNNIFNMETTLEKRKSKIVTNLFNEST